MNFQTMSLVDFLGHRTRHELFTHWMGGLPQGRFAVGRRDLGLALNRQVDLRAKMAPDGALAEPHPEPGNFTLICGPDPV